MSCNARSGRPAHLRDHDDDEVLLLELERFNRRGIVEDLAWDQLVNLWPIEGGCICTVEQDTPE